MEQLLGVEPVNENRLPLPPISSLLSAKNQKSLQVSTQSPPPPSKKTVTAHIPPPVKNQVILTSPVLNKTSKTLSSLSPSKCGKIVTSSPTFPLLSSPPPPPHLLCGLSNVQQSPAQGQLVDKMGMVPYLSEEFLDQGSIGSMNLPCSHVIQYQQPNFRDVNTLSCHTVMYQNTSIISPKVGFRSSISNHPSAWTGNFQQFNIPEHKTSPKNKKVAYQNKYSLSQNPLDFRSRTVLENFQFSYDVDQLRDLGQDVFGCSSVIPISQTSSTLQNSKTDSTDELRSIETGGNIISSVHLQGSLIQEERASSKEDDGKITTWMEDEDGSTQELESKRKLISSAYPVDTADTCITSNSSTEKQSAVPNMSSSNVEESTELNLFPYPKIDEIESVGSNDLGVDSVEYHPIALPLGCFQCNQSDTESDTASHEGSLGKRMAKMGQDQFDLHLDKTLTFFDWNLIPIQLQQVNRSVSDIAKHLQPDDPHLQQLNENDFSHADYAELTDSSTSVPGALEFQQQTLLEDNQTTGTLHVDSSVSGTREEFRDGSKLGKHPKITKNEQVNPETEKHNEIERQCEHLSKTKNEILLRQIESPSGTTSEEAMVVPCGKSSANFVSGPTSDTFSCNEVSSEHESRSLSSSDIRDTVIETHQGNPLSRIATVLSQNMSKTSKEKIGKNVERLSQNISTVIQQAKLSTDNTALTAVGSVISYTGTKPPMREDVLSMKEPHCSTSSVLTGEHDCRTPGLSKSELPPLWHDSKNCTDAHQGKTTSSQEKRLLQESAEFLGKDFSAFSRRSQRKRGIPKKLENYFSECKDVSEDFQPAVNKRKRQRTRKDAENDLSTCDRNGSSFKWNKVYQDDYVVGDCNRATEDEICQITKACETFSHDQDQTIEIDGEYLLELAPSCTQNMLKRLKQGLTTDLFCRKTRLRSQETAPVICTTDVKLRFASSFVTTTKSVTSPVTMVTSATDVNMGAINAVTIKNPKITTGHIGISTATKTMDSGTTGKSCGPMTQDCTVHITQEDTVKIQSLTKGEITCAVNYENNSTPTTSDKETTHQFIISEMQKKKVSNIPKKKSKLKKKTGFELKKAKGCLIAATKTTVMYETKLGNERVSGLEGPERAIRTRLKSTCSSEDIGALPEKKNKAGKKKVMSSTGKSKKNKLKDLSGQDSRESSVESALVAEDITKSADVNKKSKKKNVFGEKEAQLAGDGTGLTKSCKKSKGEKKSKEKADVNSLSKDFSSGQSLKTNDSLIQNSDGNETCRKKKAKSDGNFVLKGNNSKFKKGKSKTFNNLTKNITNLVNKSKAKILECYAKHGVVTDPNQEVMSSTPTDCRFCKKTVLFSDVKKHEKSHQFKCFKCCLLFNTKKEENEHVLGEHKVSEKPKKVKSPVTRLKELYHCMLCEKSFVTIKLIQRHLHSNVHGYNRHIQNRCLTMMGNHFQQSIQTLEKHDAIQAIDSGVQEESPSDQLIQQRFTFSKVENKSLKMWTLPKSLTTTEVLEKQFIKIVKPGIVNYYYREPEFLEWIKKQEYVLESRSALPNPETCQKEESYAVVTNLSMMQYLASCSNVTSVPEGQGNGTQCMHDQVGDSTNFLYRESVKNIASSCFLPTSESEHRCYTLPYDNSSDSSNFQPNNHLQMDNLSHFESNQVDSINTTAQEAVQFTVGHSIGHDNSSLNSFSADGSPLDQLSLNASMTLSTSGSDYSDLDMDQCPMGWLSRAIEDIEADPYYPDFLDSQSNLENNSSFNKFSTSEDSQVFPTTSTQPTSSESTVDTRSFRDLDSGQQVQVYNDRSLDTTEQCSHTNNTGEEDPESQELIKLEYAQILCDIRNVVLGTRSYQELTPNGQVTSYHE